MLFAYALLVISKGYSCLSSHPAVLLCRQVVCNGFFCLLHTCCFNTLHLILLFSCVLTNLTSSVICSLIAVWLSSSFLRVLEKPADKSSTLEEQVNSVNCRSMCPCAQRSPEYSIHFQVHGKPCGRKRVEWRLWDLAKMVRMSVTDHSARICMKPSQKQASLSRRPCDTVSELCFSVSSDTTGRVKRM